MRGLLIVLHDSYSLDIGFPHMVRSSMRMAHFNSEVSSLSANRANSHQ